MNLNINYRYYFKVSTFCFLILAAGFILTTDVIAQTTATSDIPSELAFMAKQMGCASKADCEKVFNDHPEKWIPVAQENNLYVKNPENQKLAETFKTQVLSQLTSAANFEEEIVKIAEKIIKDKSISGQLNLKKEDVTAARTIVTTVKNAGVDLRACSQSAESLTNEQLGACVRASKNLAENKDAVKGYISERQLNSANESDNMIKLQEALNRGEYSQLGKDADELGKVCLQPGSPSQCDEIAAKFFGADGVKYLTQARQQVSSVAKKYLKQADSFTLTTPDGKTITGEGPIRNTCDEAFESHNLALAKVCGDFAVRNGFVKQEEIDEGLKFLESVGDINFSDCRKDPKSCERFIPQDQRQQFKVGQEIESIMTSEIGLDPQQCSRGNVDPEIGKRCFEGSKRALQKLETLANSSPEARKIISMIRGNVEQGERYANKRQEFQQTFQNQGGPGGCKSHEECSAYCSNAVNGSECIAFGAKHKVFSGSEAVSRFQEYRGHVENAPSFSGQGAYPGFQPPGTTGSLPPGQIPGFTQPGPGFFPPPGIGGFPPNFGGPAGPSPECFRAIQEGDFVKAKEVCSVPGAKNLPPHQPPICPAMPTVNECPAGQEKVVTYSSPECGTYYGCRPTGSTTTPPPSSCPAGYRWDGTKCSLDSYNTDPAKGCTNAGGTWDPTTNYCKMPSTTACNFNKVCEYGESTGSCPSDCQSSTTTGCYSIGRDETKCRATSGCVWYLNHYDGNHCDDTVHGSYQKPQPPSGQKEQIWNSLGLRSWIRGDADLSRIEQLKQVCANVSSGSNIWMPGAGDYSSPDFGMPSAEKCKIASGCTSTQYFNGTSCVSGTSTTGGTGCGSSTAQASQSACLAISGCAWFNNACSPSATTTPTCPSGQHWDYNTKTCATSTTTTTCPSGQYYDSATKTCKITTTSPPPSTTTTCPSGQYWDYNTKTCVASTTTTCASGQYYDSATKTCKTTTTSPPPSTTTTCASGQYWDSATSTCKTTTTSPPPSTTTTTCPSGQHIYNGACVADSTCPSGQYWDYNTKTCATSTTTTCPSGQYYDSATKTCKTTTTSPPPSTTTTCPSGQYWNGTSCVTSTTTSPPPSTTTTCPSGQHIYNGACVADSTCPSGQYWNGTSCVTSTTSPPPSTTTTCPSGQYWNGTSCVTSTTSPPPSTTTTCPSGQYWNGTSCVTSTTSPPPSTTTTCPSGQHWDTSKSQCVASIAPKSALAAIGDFFSKLLTIFFR